MKIGDLWQPPMIRAFEFGNGIVLLIVIQNHSKEQDI